MSKFTYKNGRYFKDGEPFYFIGVDYQYYRDKETNWAERLKQLKDAHNNVVTFYTPWRHHIVEKNGQISCDITGETKGNRNLKLFLELCTKAGLYMVVKPGPFVHSELNIGGLPNVSSPTFNKELTPVRRYHGEPAYWEYDHTQLPSVYDPKFDKLAKEWLETIGKLIKPHMNPDGNIIGIQLNDETIYCTSNDPPWSTCYDDYSLGFYRTLLKEKYGSIASYNKVHGTSFKSYDQVEGQKFIKPSTINEAMSFVDWAEYQWRVRRDCYDRYKKYLGVKSTYLTNFAGITPPIKENVPDEVKEEQKDDLTPYMDLYPEWWLGMNRVDTDRDVHEYGMISWLGVASYNIPDPKSLETPPGTKENEVFNRYMNTARRRRGPNLEENWGFATLYHPFSKYPLVPFFQTLASVAGGCTGYVVFCGVQHGYWDETLDSVTKKQWPTFPSDAPITSDGKLTPMYDTMSMMNKWFEREGSAYLKAELDYDVCFLLYPEYAAISSWIPNENYWKVKDHKIPRSGRNGLEELAVTLQDNGFVHNMMEIAGSTDEELNRNKICAIRLAFFMDKKSQERLVKFVENGGKLIACGEIPTFNEKLEPCTILKDKIKGKETKVGKGLIYFTEEEIFSNGNIIKVLSELGVKQNVSHSKNMRAMVYRDNKDYYVWFFSFDKADKKYEKHVEFYGKRLDMVLGSKTSGVVHVSGDEIKSVMFKGKNEVENIDSEITIQLGDQKVSAKGDLLWVK